MRKFLLLIMSVILCFSMIACESGNNSAETVTEEITKDPNTIELTMDNYEDYLKITGISIQNSGTPIKAGTSLSGSYKEFNAYSEIRFEAEIEGVSTNFVYKDVTVTIQFSGEYYAYPFYIDESSEIEHKSFQFDLVVNTNVAGGGDNIYILDPGLNQASTLNLWTTKDVFEVNAEVVAVTGSVSLVK